MIECTRSDKPLVSILLAAYRPNKKWLIEQLISLNNQDYDNLNLYIYDDCPKIPIDEKIIKKYITNFNYKIIRARENCGSNYAFEQLTKIADGEYFAYCDQDDIWEEEKISRMIEKFSVDDVQLVCSDMLIIDENDNIIADSLTKIRKRHEYKSGYNLAKDLLLCNFVVGCAMITKKEIAKKSIPFEKSLVHDQWIAIVAALNGKIEFINEPLIKYRQHSNNQTGILTGIYDKATYYELRINQIIKRYESLKVRLIQYSDVNEYLDRCLKWMQARKNYAKNMNINDLIIMLKYRKIHRISILLEIFLPIIPDFLFKYIISLTKRGIL